MLIDGRPLSRPASTAAPSGPTLDLAREPAFGDHLTRVDRLLRQVLADASVSWQHCGDPVVASHQADSSLGDVPGLLTELLFSGGKRLRPIVGLLGFRIAGGSGTDAEQDLIRVCAALELLHSFALVQDDVMDASPSRRGRPTTHVLLAERHRDHGAVGSAARFGESVAVLVGDLAHAEADQLIGGCSAEIRRHWRRMIIELIRGQVQDLVGAAVAERDPRRALLVAQLKSGGYTIQRPLELGAAAAGADAATMAVLEEYGREAGSAFALRDDILGVWGDPVITGKPAGDDLVAGKPTVIMALAHRRLPPAGRRMLDRAGSEELTPEDVRRLQQAIADCGVRAEVEAMIQHRVGRAVSAVRRLPSGTDGTDGAAFAASALVRFAQQVAWRDR